ncbi:MAG: hypothetical protein QOC75_4266, partial [Pseudonocardiales bacterium]|nr:hypothetical protein [Pseudonocardiales bacterium]
MVDTVHDGHDGKAPSAGEPGGGLSRPPAAPSRRRLFAMAAGGIATVAVGAVVAGDVYASGRGVFASGAGPAYELWQQWDQSPMPLRLVAAAILAANAHNAQAWRFAVTPRSIDVYDDVSRSLGAVDTYRREIHLSAGCAIENITLAAGAAGFVPVVALRPPGDPTLLARVDLIPGSSRPSPLYRAIPLRHTDRGAYQTGRDLPADILVAMDALVDQPDIRVRWLVTPAQRAAFSAMTVAATRDFIADAQQASDDYAWYRATSAQIQAHRDGVSIDAGGLSPVLRSLGKLLPATVSSTNSYWLSGTRDRQLPTASGFAIVVVRDAADIVQRLNAGRLYQRLHLWATTRGLAMQPLNQVVERAERERSTTGAGAISRGLAGLVGGPDWQPVMPFRIGYSTVVAPPSPRRDIGDVVVG